MENENRMLQNLELWGRSHPKEALLMPYIDTEGVNFCTTKENEPNLCLETPGGIETIYSQEGALKEAREWFSGLDLTGTGVLYIYGIGLGEYYTAAVEWLHADENRTIVFLEDDLRVLRKFFESENAGKLLTDRQVHLFYFQSEADQKKVLDTLYWNAPLAKAKVTALRYYELSKKVSFLSLKHEIEYTSELKKSLIEEYLEFGRGYFINCYRNLMYLPGSYIGNKLYGQFKGCPAIICGAGPSLEKNMGLLKQLKNRALVFAGGSAINILNSASIQPHLCAAIDPNEAQNVRLHHAHSYEVPFFYRNRLGHSAFKTIHGPRLFLSGSGGYDIASFFESRLGLESDELDEGRNVVNFCLEIARKLGCNPIVFIGCDLAFTGGKTYSDGVVFDPSVEQQTLDQYARYETTGLLRKDINDQPIYTLWKWISESEWVGEWALKYPEIELYNCTEGGLGFPNVPNRTLRDIAESKMQREYDLSGYLHTVIQNSFSTNITTEKVIEAMEELKQSLKNCKEHLRILKEEAQSANEKLKNHPGDEPILQSGSGALAEIELSEEPAYRAVLSIFNDVFTALSIPEMQAIKYSHRTENEKRIARNLPVIKRLNFLEKVADENGACIDFALERFKEDAREAKPVMQETAPSDKSSDQSQDIFRKIQGDDEAEAVNLYYDSGALKGETYVKNGLLDGPSDFYGEDEKILAKSFFVEGKPEGEFIYYYFSGATYCKLHFVNGLPQGEQMYYHENGQLKTLLHYHEGRIVDTAFLYDEEGNPKREILFR